MRIQTREGVLVVYDAAAPPTISDEGCSGYLGYWYSARDKTQHIFPAVLQDEGDLAAVLLALERDLGVDIQALAARDHRIAEALRSVADADDEEFAWEPATPRRAVEIMGFDPEIDPVLIETGGDQTAEYCEPWSCPLSLPPPGNCGSPGGLARDGLAVTADCCDGGGPQPDPGGSGDPPPPRPCCVWAGATAAAGLVPSPDGTGTVAVVCCWCPDCPPSCDDNNACTIDSCIRGCGGAFCVHEPRTCYDGYLCTDDSCDPSTGCVFEEKNCPDPDPCTTGECDGLTGECKPSYCGSGSCCVAGENAWCCGAGKDCCPYHYDPPNNNYACCPVGKVCCSNQLTCCDTLDQCCGTGCCQAGQTCCNGDCRQACETTCCDLGWFKGECCGSSGSGCGLNQICCNGACCGGECLEASCVDGVCVTTPVCDDGNPCTNDFCTSGTCGDFTCTNTFNTAPCPDDGDPCTLDVCDGLGFCSHPAGNEYGNCPDDGTVCTDDYCQNGVCIHPCWPLCSTSCNAGTPGYWCNPCACQQEDCSVSLTSATGKPCETVTLTADCWPCGSAALALTPEYPPPYNTLIPPWLDISGPAPVNCQDASQPQTITVSIHQDAPPGPVPIRVTGTTGSGQTCEATGIVTVDRQYPPIEIQYKTFIAPAAVKVPNPLEDQYYKGDYRTFAYGFGPNLTSRSVQSTTMKLDPRVAGGQVPGPTQFFDGTVGYDDDPDWSDMVTGPAWPCTPYTYYPLPAPVPSPNCTLTATAGTGSNVLTMLPTQVSTTEVKVDITLAGKNPCEPEAPAIDAHLHVHLRQVCQNGTLGPMEFRLYGTLDGFPWHELYINGVAVYKHDVCLPPQDDAWSLLPGEEYQFEIFDDKHPPYDDNDELQLDQWHIVPSLGP